MQPKPRRPTGVTILGILSILAGLGGIIVGAAALGLSGLVASTYPGGAAVAAVIGAILLIIGIMEVVYGIGFFEGPGSASSLGSTGAIDQVVLAHVLFRVRAVRSMTAPFPAILVRYY